MNLLPMDIDILPPTDDRIFKTILTSPEAKPFLMKLIAGLIRRKVVDVTVHNNELPISDTGEKGERFDVNCKTDDGSQINLEMQASRMEEYEVGEHNNIKGRSIYYLCDLHASQSAKGQHRYDKLVRTYQVTFCSYTIFPHRKDFLNTFSLRHDADNERLHDAVQIMFIELSKLDDILKKPVDNMTDMEKFSLFFQYADKPLYRDTINKVIESEEVLTVATHLLMNISQDERERAIFRSRRKFQMDHASDLATAQDRGKAQGRYAERHDIARNLLKMNLPLDQIVMATNLTRDEVEKLN